MGAKVSQGINTRRDVARNKHAKSVDEKDYWERKIEPLLGDVIVEALRLQPQHFKKWLHHQFMDALGVIDDADKPDNHDRHSFSLALNNAKSHIIAQALQNRDKSLQIDVLTNEVEAVTKDVENLKSLLQKKKKSSTSPPMTVNISAPIGTTVLPPSLSLMPSSASRSPSRSHTIALEESLAMAAAEQMRRNEEKKKLFEIRLHQAEEFLNHLLSTEALLTQQLKKIPEATVALNRVYSTMQTGGSGYSPIRNTPMHGNLAQPPSMFGDSPSAFNELIMQQKLNSPQPNNINNNNNNNSGAGALRQPQLINIQPNPPTKQSSQQSSLSSPRPQQTNLTTNANAPTKGPVVLQPPLSPQQQQQQQQQPASRYEKPTLPSNNSSANIIVVPPTAAVTIAAPNTQYNLGKTPSAAGQVQNTSAAPPPPVAANQVSHPPIPVVAVPIPGNNITNNPTVNNNNNNPNSSSIYMHQVQPTQSQPQQQKQMQQHQQPSGHNANHNSDATPGSPNADYQKNQKERLAELRATLDKYTKVRDAHERDILNHLYDHQSKLIQNGSPTHNATNSGAAGRSKDFNSNNSINQLKHSPVEPVLDGKSPTFHHPNRRAVIKQGPLIKPSQDDDDVLFE